MISFLVMIRYCQGPGQIDLRVEAFMKTFEATLLELTNEEFKVGPHESLHSRIPPSLLSLMQSSNFPFVESCQCIDRQET